MRTVNRRRCRRNRRRMLSALTRQTLPRCASSARRDHNPNPDAPSATCPRHPQRAADTSATTRHLDKQALSRRSACARTLAHRCQPSLVNSCSAAASSRSRSCLRRCSRFPVAEPALLDHRRLPAVGLARRGPSTPRTARRRRATLRGRAARAGSARSAAHLRARARRHARPAWPAHSCHEASTVSCPYEAPSAGISPRGSYATPAAQPRKQPECAPAMPAGFALRDDLGTE